MTKSNEVSYTDTAELPNIDLYASFLTSTTPRWYSKTRTLRELIALANTMTGKEVKVVVVNSSTWKWLVSNTFFTDQFKPSKEHLKISNQGLLGLFLRHLVVVTDSFMHPDEQFTENMAYYVCDLVELEKKEVPNGDSV